MKQYFLNPPYTHITLLSVSFMWLLILEVLILLVFEVRCGSLTLNVLLSPVIISPYLYESYPVPIIPQPEILSSVAYNPITVWTTTGLLPSPLPNDLSPLSGYPSSLGRVSPPPPSDTSSKDHSGSESPISDEEERIQSKLSDPHAIEAEKFQCSLCNKTYSTFSGLAKHKQLHCDAQSRKSFSCKYCDKEYVSLGALKMHIRTHTLPCVCKICGKAFSRPWLLQGHIRTHTGKSKRYICSFLLL